MQYNKKQCRYCSKSLNHNKTDSKNKDVVNKVTSIVNNKADKQKRINSYKRIRKVNLFKKFKKRTRDEI